MVFRRAVAYKLSGPLDQRTLDSLRTSLDLTPTGRLADDWDEIFGEREAERDGVRVEFSLSRDESRGGWEVNLSVDGQADPTALEPFESEITSAAAAAGLTVESVLRPS
ncbi:hypothetical protein O7600_07620 [Micromonospora sp. WMMA1998]|uniref:hypothetical protein n=1 Tax=Micromonospora sp. WMMA1998 TaxID=3015167 RepID=UPI00248BA3D3|nr:hypothetical protein [Micromonospora sp. WMMA1998]WBC16699.1 hypothetical protein O7600_07620 [Micromonospora sp. WMMA1998]